MPKTTNKKQEGRKIIVCDIDKCTGCRVCEYVCSAFNQGKLNMRSSRIKTVRVEPVFNAAVSCLLCEDMPCLEGCPTQAITYNEKKQHIQIDSEKCTGCGYCDERCPYGCITIEPVENKALVCDFCNENNKGQPRCVEYCPKDALTYEEAKPGTYQHSLLSQKSEQAKEESKPDIDDEPCCS